MPHTDVATPAGKLLNRELSWLEFNARVLALAEDPDVPLLERVRFCAIFSNNLDEFFSVRVAGLLDQAASGLAVRSPDGMTPREALAAVRARITELTQRQSKLWKRESARRSPTRASVSAPSTSSPRRSYARSSAPSRRRSSRC